MGHLFFFFQLSTGQKVHLEKMCDTMKTLQLPAHTVRLQLSELRLSERSIIQALCPGPCLYAYVDKQPRLSKLLIIRTFLLVPACLDNRGCAIVPLGYPVLHLL